MDGHSNWRPKPVSAQLLVTQSTPSARFWVITPSYNSLRWLPCAVASVADQACNGIEIHHHVQDGGSNDGTGEWLAGYADQCRLKPRANYTFSYESSEMSAFLQNAVAL